MKTFRQYLESTNKSSAETIIENKARTGLKFGYPDGYYRNQYPGLYSTPISATALVDLENEKNAPKEIMNGPKMVGKISFLEYLKNKKLV